jgi:predicted Zn-dependent protease
MSLASGDILSRAECDALAKRVLAFAKAEETRVTIDSTARSDTRFAGNQISTSGEDTDTTITIRSAFGKRNASVTTNKLDDASLSAAVREAETLAHLSPEGPESMPELGPQTYQTAPARLATMPSAADRAAAIGAVTARARKAGCFSTGYIETQLGATAIANSRGLFAYDQRSGTTMTMTVRTSDATGSGWAGMDAETWPEIDAAQLGAHATEKAIKSRHPIAAEPGQYTVVLEPAAVGNLVSLILDDLSARSADEGRSYFSRPSGGNKIGQRVLSDAVTLVSDPADHSGSLFTEGGLPTRRVVWVERGVLKTLNYTRYWAQKSGTQPTAAPDNTLRMLGGKMSLPRMIATTRQGLLITRFWYIRSVDPRTLLYTGLTRDGTFEIADGKVTRSVKNFRFNESPIFMLNRIDALGVPVRTSASEDGSPGDAIIMPALKCHDFTLSSLSDAI